MILLVKEIAKQANFSLTERPSRDKSIIDFVYAGVEGAWEDQVQLDSCDEPLRTQSSVSQLTDTDSEDVVVVHEAVCDDLGGSQASLSGAEGVLENQVLQLPCTAPSHPYQPPQIIEARTGWYMGEDCFDPGEVAPEASPPQLPSTDGVERRLCLHCLLTFSSIRDGPFRGAAHYSRTNKGKNGKRSRLPEQTR